MRLNLRLSSNTEPVSFNHLHELTKTIHRWTGPNNDFHDGLSLYSFGWLDGGVGNDDHLTFPEGARWRVSFHDDAAADRVIRGILEDTDVFAGMTVENVEQQSSPVFSKRCRFRVDGPVITRAVRSDGSRSYLTHKDEKAGSQMTQTLRRKLKKMGFTGEHLDTTVQFAPYSNPRIKTVKVKGTAHKGSVCPVIISGTSEAIQAAWTTGVGELTGSGFGALK